MATQLRSILETSMFAYTIYGAAVTPALIAALVWKRATKAGGLASIIGGTVACLFFFIMTRVLPPDRVPDGDPWGIPLIYPALIVSIGSLIVVSLLTPRPEPKIIEKLFPSP